MESMLIAVHSQTLKLWYCICFQPDLPQQPPVDQEIRIFVFNVTNPADVVEGLTPRIREVPVCCCKRSLSWGQVGCNIAIVGPPTFDYINQCESSWLWFISTISILAVLPTKKWLVVQIWTSM